MTSLFRMAVPLGIAITTAGVIDKFCLYTVDGGFRAVIFDRLRGGVLDKVSGEGTWPLIPYVQEAVLMDIRSRPHTTAAKTGTKDLQTVDIHLRILTRPVPDKLPWIYQNLSVDYEKRVLPSVCTEVLKAIVAKYNAEDLLRKREQVSLEIGRTLTNRVKEFNLMLDDVSITHLEFGREYARAIEAKQVAQQDAERAHFVVRKNEQEMKAVIIRAEGEAEAAKLVSDAIEDAGPGLVEVRRIDAAKEAAAVLARSRNITFLPSGRSTSSQGGTTGSASGTNILLDMRS